LQDPAHVSAQPRRHRERAGEDLVRQPLAAGPFYLGLAISIGILLIKFVQELYHLVQKTLVATEAETILGC